MLFFARPSAPPAPRIACASESPGTVFAISAITGPPKLIALDTVSLDTEGDLLQLVEPITATHSTSAKASRNVGWEVMIELLPWMVLTDAGKSLPEKRRVRGPTDGEAKRDGGYAVREGVTRGKGKKL